MARTARRRAALAPPRRPGGRAASSSRRAPACAPRRSGTRLAESCRASRATARARPSSRRISSPRSPARCCWWRSAYPSSCPPSRAGGCSAATVACSAPSSRGRSRRRRRGTACTTRSSPWSSSGTLPRLSHSTGCARTARCYRTRRCATAASSRSSTRTPPSWRLCATGRQSSARTSGWRGTAPTRTTCTTPPSSPRASGCASWRACRPKSFTCGSTT
mmetsp:Transcript_32978/g.105794  ORF Transcript_32978/g.105794 Transcript_32978/m.105794 type:complete len:219 (+) Transcript_32978:896-1552(+)